MQLLPLLLAAAGLVEAYPMQVLKTYSTKPYAQEALDSYNVLRFLGTASPYVQQPGHGIQRDVPYGCEVSQVNLIARHGERYFTASKGASISEKLGRFVNMTGGELSGELEWLATYDWEAFDEDMYDAETYKGPYAGLGEMYKFGQQFREQYNHLIDPENITVYTASQERVVVSAQKFAEGLLGKSVDNSSFVVIDEDDASLGANSLTPVEGCSNYDDSTNEDLVAQYSDSYLNATAERLNSATENLNITPDEVKGLLEYCGFGLNVNGRAEICEIFTTDELLARAYYNDLDYYYTKGPGYNLSNAIGSAYVNAMVKMMSEDSRNHTLSFAHDTDIFFIVTLLGLYDGDLPTEYIDFNAAWKTSNINPMGSRLIFERLECGDDTFVRIVHNDAVLPIAEISSGPGFSAPLDKFEEYIQDRLDGQTYAEACGIDNNVPDELTFFWD